MTRDRSLQLRGAVSTRCVVRSFSSVFFPSSDFRESSCEYGEGVRLPRDLGADFLGTSAELPGKLSGSLWIAVKSHSERTSGEVAGKLPGKFRELPGKSGDFPEAR